MTAPNPGDVVVERRHREAAMSAMGVEKPSSADYVTVFLDYGSDPSIIFPITRAVAKALATIEHNARPRWKPLLGVLAVDEGTTYLFAIETGDGWEYFSDSIGWDADEETVPSWYSGAHGWSLDAELFFAALPEPPKEPT